MIDKKKDLIPIAAIAVFLVIIILLCAVRLNERKKETAAGEGNVETVQTFTEETQSETESTQEADVALLPEETREETEEETQQLSENQLPSGREKEEAQKPAASDGSTRTISGNNPFAAAEGVNKSNEEMLVEMAGYWEQDNMDAVEDLAHLAWFMKMSASIADEDTFYYYGERNDQGQPNGLGIACYAGNEYYYGQWVNGMREGDGEWIKYYIYYDDDTASDRAYQLHMYHGEWAADLPNGDGQEHYDLDMSQAADQGRYIQNVIGTFKDGLYSGEMYLTTLNWDGNQEEWNGLADEGVWNPYGAATNKREVPVCQDVDDGNNYLWIQTRSNKDRGIAELMP